MFCKCILNLFNNNMCEIFPEVTNCCLCIPLRLATLMISVLAIMTGVAGMSSVIQMTGTDYDSFEDYIQRRDLKNFLSSEFMVPGGTEVVSALFIFSGSVLFIAALTDSEGLAQMFVWITFLALLVAVFVIFLTAYQCIVYESKCPLKTMDWLSSSGVLTSGIIYIAVWVYFISVVNSYATTTFE